MPTTLTSKGQVTIPKQIRDALSMTPGCLVDFAVTTQGDVDIHKVGAPSGCAPDRFAAARGKADVKWRTDDLLALLRGEGCCCSWTPTCWSTLFPPQAKTLHRPSPECFTWVLGLKLV